MKHWLSCSAGAMLSLAVVANSSEIFTERERAMILSHGPWPAVTSTDPSNRVSGQQNAIALGAQLFFDARLSRTADISCASCHKPNYAFGDNTPLSTGTVELERNTIALANLRLNRWFGWDGSADNLWAQSIRPLINPREMAASATHIANVLRDNDKLQTAYERTFDASALSTEDDVLLVNVAKALAAFQETITTPRTSFDDFRDAVDRDDRAAMARYPATAKRGLALFVGRAQCTVCHAGPNFSNGEFQEAGVAYFTSNGSVDSGRHGGIKALKKSPYTLLGDFNDDASKSNAAASRHVALRQRNFGEFRVPTLRNVERTGPYMHAGSLDTLESVVRHYNTIDTERVHADGRRLLRPLGLTDADVDALVAFLKTLSH